MVSLILESISMHGTLFPLIARSPTYVVNFLPNSPAGWDFAKSSLEKFFSSLKKLPMHPQLPSMQWLNLWAQDHVDKLLFQLEL